MGPTVAMAALLVAIVGVIYWRYRATARADLPAGVADAALLIWTVRWNLPANRLPSLEAVRQEHLTCGHDATGKPAPTGYRTPAGQCVGGQTALYASGPTCTVAFPDGVPLHQTALAHEMMHARRWLELPDSIDETETEAHAAPGFLAEVDATNTWLEHRGL